MVLLGEADVFDRLLSPVLIEQRLGDGGVAGDQAPPLEHHVRVGQVQPQPQVQCLPQQPLGLHRVAAAGGHVPKPL